ncbi:MAG: carbohydrate porin [Myxococcota bacterium]|nr:carbohydrate porin [Myxococcota bacterium]
MGRNAGQNPKALVTSWGFGLFVALALAGAARSEVPGGGTATTASDGTGASPAEAPAGDSTLRREVQADGSRLFRFHPIWNGSQQLKEFLARYGLTYSLETAFYEQYASRVTQGQKNFGTFSWRLSASWRFWPTASLGAFFLETSFLGSPGLNYDPSLEVITRNVGSISTLNGNIYPFGIALDEVMVKYISPSTEYVGGIGKVDLTNRFDTNRVANDSFRQFIAFALENNLSIPWPVYGGLGGFARVNLGENAYLSVGVAASVVDRAFQFGRNIGDGNWIEMLELGAEFQVPGLGLGHYRLTPWHADFPDAEGWGVGVNFDQALGNPEVVSFFRFGYGEPSATPIQTFASFGVTWLRPFGRADEMAGVGFAWSNPSPGQGLQDETLIEVFYRFAILPWIHISPDLQVVFHPANDPKRGTVFVPGIRLSVSL